MLGPNGDKVYGIPTNASSVLEIDPLQRKVTTFGQLGEPTTALECSGKLHCGVEKWIGGVLADNGHIIGIPYGAESVLDIDTATHTASTFGVLASGGPRKWIGGALGHNSMVYAIPFDAGDVLEINPYTKALTRFGNLGLQACKWYGGVRAPNGRICARRGECEPAPSAAQDSATTSEHAHRHL